ncbi:alpha-galactosidase [Anaerocolumna xylanovorans]|uniref:Alpha-galactosidase n=1 Tax=Anaerocolumna xylanovorans DSM 12503 TaxID=1121345 RepID=A0A1M7XX13_9FIRM|nr:alpha-galactosidase [Anaerocolumna xylanovorans]SHO43401.1 alpha-galactosidase [Anaerocolumna xylanovorans DSM 12503]
MKAYSQSIRKKLYEQYSVTEYCSCTLAGDIEEVTLCGYEMDIAAARYPVCITYYESGWGKEYRERKFDLGERQEFYIENTRGRSSHQYHPFCIIACEDNVVMLLALAWSGNWYLRITEDGRILSGQTKEMFTRVLKAGEEFYSPSVITAQTEDGDLDTLINRMHRFGRDIWLKYNAESRSLWTEWNHWWTFEDCGINEEVFLANARKAAELGIELCTLDAGWFGNSTDITWSKLQGDWSKCNKERFPHGIRYLSDNVHKERMKFGIWMEPEAMGTMSELRKEHPEWEALRDGKPCNSPYVCLGNKETEEWLFQTMTALVEDTGCDHIKLDFNLDPELGCNREDHGHQKNDGLQVHYEGYYRVLKRVGERFPHLVIENCSSGGLRTDYGIMKWAHTAFLSDVDISSHSLNCFWHLSMFLPVENILHWIWSETREYEDGTHVFESFPMDEDAEESRIKYTLRAAMLHQLGISRDLTKLSPKWSRLIKSELDFYKNCIRPLLGKGDFFHVLRTEDIYAFLIKDEEKGYLFLYNTGSTVHQPSLIIRGYDNSCKCKIENIDTGVGQYYRGKQLLEQGFPADAINGESAAIYKIIEMK